MESKRIRLIISGLLIAFMGLQQACYWDNEEDLYPVVGDCDTSNVTYSGTVAIILQNNCVSCHNSSFGNGGVVVDNYSDLKVVVNNGRFWGAINHQKGYTPMPQNLPKLNVCDLEKIRIWIDKGAMND